MSRIRSIHPGLWTDEDFVTLSPFARLLFMGLWNECDDKGIFEWKPLTIKMRLLPADNLDISELLEELTSVGCIRRYEMDGKSFGAVRNFGKFQRPKKPNNIHPATAEILTFCETGSEPNNIQGDEVPNQLPTGGEIGAQMEEGGGREGGKEEKAYAFSARVVRLNRSDFTSFRERFHAIPDFEAELTAFDGWMADQPESKQAKWFGSLAPWLNKRHQEALARAGPVNAGEIW